MLEKVYSLGLSKIDDFFKTSSLMQYKKRNIILNSKNDSLNVFYIKSGFLRVYRISEQGEELTFAILKPGDFFPLTYGISDINNAYYIEAITKVELWKSTQENFVAFIKNNPDVLYELTTRILVKFDGVLTRIEYMVFHNAYIKVATTLLVCAKKFGEQQGENMILQVPLTHRDIATLAGITRETTSLEMKKLEKQGFLDKIGRLFIIKNIKQLEHIIVYTTDENFSLNYTL